MASYGTQEVLNDIPEVTFVGTKRPSRTSCIEENELLNGSGSRTSIKDSKRRDKNGNSGASEQDLIEYLKNTTYDSFRGNHTHEMQDAPFSDSRAGSEDDMLEYDEPILNCDFCCRRRKRCSKTEKLLLVFGVVCLVIIIVLAVKIGNKKPERVMKVCESKECLNAASSIIEAMDTTADPCEDFHQYSCGGWLRETPIPPGYPVYNRFQELSHKNLYMLKNYIETHSLYGQAQNNVRMFYQSCMDESQVKRDKTLNQFRSILKKVSDMTQDFNFPSTLFESHKLDSWPLFRLTVGPDERNPDKNIIKIEAGNSPFPYGIFKSTVKKSIHERESSTSSKPPTSTSKMAPAKVSTSKPNMDNVNNKTSSSMATEGNSTINSTDTESTTNHTAVVVDHRNGTDAAGYTVIAETTTKVPHIKDTHPHPKENISDLVKDYLKETSIMLQVLWNKTKTEAEHEAKLIFELERRLSLAHDIELHVHNRTQAYNAMAIQTLQEKCGSMIDWTKSLNGIMGTPSRQITNKHEVIVLHEKALFEVCSIVEEYRGNKTLHSVLRHHLLLGVVRSLKPYFDMSTFQIDIDPEKEIEVEGEHWKRCTFYANKALGLATGAIYVNATSAHESVNQVKHMVDYVKRAFKDYLLRKMWLDAKTKSNAEAKINEMIEKVSYPSYILNTTFIDTYYKQFSVGSDWFRNLLNWRAFAISNMVLTLDEKYDRKNSWINPPVTVESDYSPVRNDVIFPIALFHLPIFSSDGPSAMNFGAMGSVIGHEITHAFDIQGRQYDGFGRLRDWWDPVTASKFNETTRCMKDQYDHFKIGNMTINGEQTLEENIADNGGLRAAHIAYELWLIEHGDEQPLPGVNLNNKQIFYISFAQLYCSKWKDDGIKNFLVRDTHSPGPFRIEGALSNSLSFQDVFQCSNIARYNPSLKCRVW